MTVVERSSLIQKLYNRADETIPDNPYKKARQRGYREAFETVLSARTVEAERVVYCKDCKRHEAEQPGMVYCPRIVGGWVDNYFYCADGREKKDNEERKES